MKTLILMAMMAVGILGATAQAKDTSQSIERKAKPSARVSGVLSKAVIRLKEDVELRI